MAYIVEMKSYPYLMRKVTSLGKTPHIHTHLELVYVLEGKALATLNGTDYLLTPGDLFLAFPDQIHHYEADEGICAYVLIFSKDLHRDVSSLLEEQTPLCPVLKKDALSGSVEEYLRRIHEASTAPSPFCLMSALGSLLSLLGAILPLFSYEESSSDPDSMRRVLSYLAEHYTEKITLESFSRAVFLNPCYVSHLFQKKMHLSFTQVLSYLRVDHAKKLLQQGIPIVEAAFSSGFSSLRTFNRVFRSRTGKTPGEYRKR